MADNQSSLNENLIAAGLNPSNPTSTYVDFAEQVAKNQAEQAQQEQTLALAKQHVAQATLDTKQKTEADQAGVNPELKDVMSKDQALAQIKLLIETKGLPLDEKALQALAGTLPAMVPASQIEIFANRFARAIAKFGQATEISTDQIIKVPSGKSAADLGLVYDASMKTDDKESSDGTKTAHVPDDGMYQIVIDEAGNVIRYTLGGKEAADTTAKDSAKAKADTEKMWSKLDGVVNGAFKTRSGGLGSLSTAIFRAVRAINTLTATPNLTAQDLANVAQDVAGIFQGGAPTVLTAGDNDYSTTLTNIANWFRHQTGFMVNVGKLFGKDSNPLDPTRKKLLQVCVDLRDSAIKNISEFIESEKEGYEGIINENPARWEKFKADKIEFAESGRIIPKVGQLLPDYSPSRPWLGASPLNITGDDQAITAKDPYDKPDTAGNNQDKKDALRKKLGLPTQGK